MNTLSANFALRLALTIPIKYAQCKSNTSFPRPLSTSHQPFQLDTVHSPGQQIYPREEAVQERDIETDCCCGYHSSADLFGALDDLVVDVCYTGQRQRVMLGGSRDRTDPRRFSQYTRRHLRQSS